MPPTTTTTKTIEAHGPGHRRLGDVGVAADHAGERRQRRAAAEDEHEHARHVVAERLRPSPGASTPPDHEADTRARQQQPDREQHQQRDEHDERTRLRELRAVEREQRPAAARAARRNGRVALATSRTSSRIRYDRPKVTSSSGTWPNLCTRRRHTRSNNAPSAPTSGGVTTSAGQNPITPDSVGEVGAEHVEARVGEVQHAHHAEDQVRPELSMNSSSP